MTAAAAGAAPLWLQGISKRLGYTQVLRDVRMTVDAGQIVALMGANGAGKSTLLRVVATILRPTAGEGSIYGHALGSDRDVLRAMVGYLGHGTGIYDGLTATENLWLAGRLFGVADLPARVSAAIARAGLEASRNAMVRTFSKGMARRLALERVCLHGPRLLLLDEPFDGLDPRARQALEVRLSEHRAGGGAVLLVSHEVDAVRSLCDRALVLARGAVAHDLPATSPELPDALLEAGAR